MMKMVKSKRQAAQNDSISNRTGLMLMMLVLLLAFAFSVKGLNAHPFWTDELYSVSNMGGFDPPYTPAQVVHSVSSHFPDHVPLFFLLGAGWAHLAGWTQFALRLLAVLTGMLAIAWLYRFGADVFNCRTGLVAAMLMGTSAYVILHFHNFRMYPLLLMFAAMHTWFYWRLAHGYRVTRLTWCWFVATAVALVYTHMFSIIWFAGLGLYHLIFVSKSRRWLQAALGWGIGALLFLPYLPVLISGVQLASSPEKFNVTSAAAPPEVLIRAFFYLLGNGSDALFVLLAGLLAFAFWRKRDAAVIKFMLLPLTMMTLMILANELVGLIPLNRMRYFLMLWIPFMLLFAYGLSMAPRWRWVTALCLLLWGIAGAQFYRSDDILGYVGGMAFSYKYPPMQDYIYHLEGKARPQDYLLGFTSSPNVNKSRELGKSVADFYTELHLGIDGGFILRRAFGEWLEENIRDQMTGSPYLLFAYDPQDKPKNFDRVMNEIAAGYVPCDVIVDMPNLFIQRYVTPMLDCHREYAPIVYDNGIKVVDRFARYVPDADLVRILTGWEVADEQLLYEYNVSLQIITPDWQNTGRQIDRHLYEPEVLKWYKAELPTEGLPPGDYRVIVVVYDRETNKKVGGTDLVTGEAANIFSIQTFTIEPPG